MPLHFLLPLSSIWLCKFRWAIGKSLQGEEADAEALSAPYSVWGCYFRLALTCSPQLNTQLWLEHFNCISEAHFSMFVCELRDWSVNWITVGWSGMMGDWLQKCISDHSKMCVDTSFCAAGILTLTHQVFLSACLVLGFMLWQCILSLLTSFLSGMHCCASSVPKDVLWTQD